MIARTIETAVREYIPYADPKLPLVIRHKCGKVGKSLNSFACHAEIEIHFVARGTIAYVIQDKHYRLLPGSLLIIYPNESHFLRHDAGQTFLEKISFIFKPSLAAAIWSPKTISTRRYHRHARLSASEIALLTGIAITISSEFKNRAVDWIPMCRLKINELAVLAKRAMLHPIEADQSHPLIENILTFVDSNYDEPIDIPGLARRAGISAGRLMHVFKQHIGIGIKQYILLQRVAKASDMLLRDATLKVEAVARAVGFVYFSDFNRIFKKYTGLTASAYRAAGGRGHRQVTNARLNGAIQLQNK